MRRSIVDVCLYTLPVKTSHIKNATVATFTLLFIDIKTLTCEVCLSDTRHANYTSINIINKRWTRRHICLRRTFILLQISVCKINKIA